MEVETGRWPGPLADGFLCVVSRDEVPSLQTPTVTSFLVRAIFFEFGRLVGPAVLGASQACGPPPGRATRLGPRSARRDPTAA